MRSVFFFAGAKLESLGFVGECLFWINSTQIMWEECLLSWEKCCQNCLEI